MSMKQLILSYLIGFVLLGVLNIYLMKNSNIKSKITRYHYFFGFLFMLYLLIALKGVVGFSCISEWQRMIRIGEPIFNPQVNLVPFKGGIEFSGILNIIFFMPFGFLLPTLWERYRRFWEALWQGILFSLVIEFGQLFVLHRATDINDLIMNGLGTICGFIIFKFMSKIFVNLASKTAVQSTKSSNFIVNSELHLYIGIAIISALLG